MKENYIHKSNYFCGNEISSYGLEHKRVDYATLAKAFDAVLCNDITKLFYSTVNGDFIEPEYINGFIDNSEKIEAKREQIEALENTRDNSENDEQIAYIDGQIAIINEQIDALEWEQHESENREIYQYYIINHSGARLLEKLTNEMVYYIPDLDMYIWGVTHFGTSWNYVLTDIVIDLSEDI